MPSDRSTLMGLIILQLTDMDMAMDTAWNRRTRNPDSVRRKRDPESRSPREVGMKVMATNWRNAIVFIVLPDGKQLQLWDSNVHNKETQYGSVWQAPRKCHK